MCRRMEIWIKRCLVKFKIRFINLIKVIDFQNIFFILLPLSTIVFFIAIHIYNLGIGVTYKIFLEISFITPTLFFFINTIKKNTRTNFTQEIQEFVLKKRMSYFTLFLSLLVFYATFFIGLLIFQEKSPVGEIPYLKDGTIGIRSWQSRVNVKKIKIHYHDSLGIWRQVPDSIVYDSTNWTMTSWNHNKLRVQIDLLKNRGWLKKLFYPKNITICDSVDHFIHTKDSSFLVQNCALIFTPQDNYQNVFHDIRFDCEVYFEKINKPVDRLFPGFQLITLIDTNLVFNEKGVKDFSELCLQFNLGMNNNHIPWIPGLDYEPPVKFVSAINKMVRFGNYDNMIEKKQYKISAIIIGDKVLFLGHTDGSVKLFEAQLATNK